MPKIIVSGRGGSGKSTLVTLLARSLGENSDVLVVDADESNLGLPLMLGLEPPAETVMGHLGGKRAVGKKLMRSIQSEGEEKVSLFDEEITAGDLPGEIVSGNGQVSLVRIGKIEHAMEGCACPMGATARAFLNSLSVDECAWVIVDTEAGVEHFGRGVMEGVDMVLMVVDPSHEAVLLAGKASALAGEAGKPFGVVLNKVDEESRPALEEAMEKRGLEPLGVMPYSREITGANLAGETLDHEHVRAELQPVIAAIESRT